MLNCHEPVEWLVRVALGGGLVLLLVWAVLRWVTEPARRQRLGEWGVAAALLVAVLCLAPGRLELPVLPHDEPTRAADPAPVALTAPLEPGDAGEWDGPFDDGDDIDVTEPSAADAATPTDPASGQADEIAWWEDLWPAALLTVWAAGTLYFLGRLLAGAWALRRFRRRAVAVPDAVRAEFEDMTADLPRALLLMRPHLRTPLSFGLWWPTVIVPAGLCGPDNAHRLRLVLAHEVAHLRRRDAWTCLLFSVAQPVFWFLPWFWELRRQVELCQEYLADEATVRTCAEAPTEYADFLVRWARRTRLPAGALGLWGRPSDLRQRITMLLTRSRSLEPACPRRWSWFVGTSLVALATVLGSMTLTAPAAPVLRHDAPCVAAVEAPEVPDPGPTAPTTPTEATTQDKPMVDMPPPPADGPRTPSEPRRPAGPPRLEDVVRGLTKNIDPKQVQAAKEGIENARKVAEQLQKQWQTMQSQRPQGPPGPGFGLPRPQRNTRLSPVETRLGASFDRLSPAQSRQHGLGPDQGLAVDDVQANSLAARAGLQEGDVLVKIGTWRVPGNVEEFGRLLREPRLEGAQDLMVVRDNKKETLHGVHLGEQPREEARRPGGEQRGEPRGPAFLGPGGKGGPSRGGMGQPRRR